MRRHLKCANSSESAACGEQCSFDLREEVGEGLFEFFEVEGVIAEQAMFEVDFEQELEELTAEVRIDAAEQRFELACGGGGGGGILQ
jgi:hypothetical protein